MWWFCDKNLYSCCAATAGDKIVKINDESTEGFSLQDAVSRIRGEPGEPIRLTLLREGVAEPKEYELERAATIDQLTQIAVLRMKEALS